MTQKALSTWETKEFNLNKGLTQAFISNIVKKHSELEGMDSCSLNAKRQRLFHHPVVEKAMILWVLQCQHRGFIPTGGINCKNLEDTLYHLESRMTTLISLTDDGSKRWQHHNFLSILIHGEIGSVDMEALNEALLEPMTVIGEYPTCNVYNMDELVSSCLLLVKME